MYTQITHKRNPAKPPIHCNEYTKHTVVHSLVPRLLIRQGTRLYNAVMLGLVTRVLYTPADVAVIRSNCITLVF